MWAYYSNIFQCLSAFTHSMFKNQLLIDAYLFYSRLISLKEIGIREDFF